MNRKKSGFERGLILELWIARISAWLLWLFFATIIVALIVGYRPVSNEGWVAVAVFFFAVASSEAEQDAEKKLSLIWEIEQKVNLVK